MDICNDHSMEFIGPKSDQIRMMGDKSTARDTMKVSPYVCTSNLAADQLRLSELQFFWFIPWSFVIGHGHRYWEKVEKLGRSQK